MKRPNSSSAITIGIDLGDRKQSVCVWDAKGSVIKQESIANLHGSLAALIRRYRGVQTAR
jgi:predicted NBD/HSP70 family sugar kinase